MTQKEKIRKLEKQIARLRQRLRIVEQYMAKQELKEISNGTCRQDTKHKS